jgi:hypothetical protein
MMVIRLRFFRGKRKKSRKYEGVWVMGHPVLITHRVFQRLRLVLDFPRL